jgi:3'-5' exoribonuclease
MIIVAEKMCDIYLNLNKDLVISGVILHDIEKINEIDANELGIATGYSFEGQMLGHIVQGIIKINKMAEELGVSHEKTVMLEHMILAHHYEPEFGSPKKPLFPEAEMVHYIDVIDARMYDMQEALEATEPGEFSERVWTLDNRRLYKVKDSE